MPLKWVFVGFILEGVSFKGHECALHSIFVASFIEGVENPDIFPFVQIGEHIIWYQEEDRKCVYVFERFIKRMHGFDVIQRDVKKGDVPASVGRFVVYEQ